MIAALLRWLNATTSRWGAPAPDTQAPEDTAPAPMKISDVALAEASMSGREAINPWDIRAHSIKPAPGVVPEGETPTALAMDAAPGEWSSVAAWAQQGILSEGLGFLGYPYLAELSQRPEYRRISEIIAEAMTRRWIKLNGPEEKCQQLEDAMRRFKVREHFRKLAELDGFFGRAHLFVDMGTGALPGELETPLLVKKEKIGKGRLKGFKVVEPLWVYPGMYESTNPLDPDYYRPRDWYVMGRVVHRSRLLPFVGREMPDMLKPTYQFGGLSLSQMAKPYVDNWLRTRQSVSDLINAFSIMVLKTDMQAILAGGGAETLIKRIAIFNKTRSNRGLMAINRDSEELDNVSAPLGTLDSLQAQSQEQLASVSGIPLVELLGVTPAGLNASSEGELKAYYGRIHDDQEHLFRDHLQTVLQILMLNEWGVIDDEITFEFVHLWEMDDEARARIQYTKAQADAAYVDMGVVGPEEVRIKLNDDEEGPYFNSLAGEPPEPPDADNDDDKREMDDLATAAE